MKARNSMRSTEQPAVTNQRLLNIIGQHLTSLSDLETLLRSAQSYLRDDLCYKGARIVLKDRAVKLRRTANLFAIQGPASATVRVGLGNQTLGDIVLPLKGPEELSGIELQTLETFAGFLALALNNIRRFEEIRALASTDPLTGMMNRRRLFEIGSQELSCARTTGLIVFDIDGLKSINDTLGHPAGDALIRSIAARAKACIRRADLLARYGGDEFVILLPNADLNGVRQIAERVRAYIESTGVEWKGQLLRSTVSLGFACVEGDVDLPSLLHRADDALYAAKQAGKNVVASASVRPSQ